MSMVNQVGKLVELSGDPLAKLMLLSCTMSGQKQLIESAYAQAILENEALWERVRHVSNPASILDPNYVMFSECSEDDRQQFCRILMHNLAVLIKESETAAAG